MSELQRAFAKAKMAGLPFDPPFPSDWSDHGDHVELGEEENVEFDELKPLPDSTQDDDSSSASSASSTSSTNTIKPSPSKNRFARPKFVQIPLNQGIPLLRDLLSMSPTSAAIFVLHHTRNPDP